MQIDAAQAERLVGIALEAVPNGDKAMESALNGLAAPIYVTDVAGTIIYYNAACVDFAGRRPELRQDNWCVTWRLYTKEGEHLPHDRCPMAVAVQERRPVRGVEAVAERPDGSRVAFIPFPTPLFDADGTFAGAVNLLVDVTEQRQAQHLRTQAERCRRLAAAVTDQRTVDTLKLMADDYADQAEGLARPS